MYYASLSIWLACAGTVLATPSLTTSSPSCTTQDCQPTGFLIPACASNCFSAAASSVNCQATDFACQCSSSSQVMSLASNCYGYQCSNTAAPSDVASSFSAVCGCESTAVVCATAPATTTATTTTTTASSTGHHYPAACSASARALPRCASACYDEAGEAAGCACDDVACQCRKRAWINNAATRCIRRTCPSHQYNAICAKFDAVCSCFDHCD